VLDLRLVACESFGAQLGVLRLDRPGPLRVARLRVGGGGWETHRSQSGVSDADTARLPGQNALEREDAQYAP